MNDFNLIINTINANDLITRSSKLLCVMYAIIGELIFIHSTSQTKIYLNTVRNLALCILLDVQCMNEVVWSLTIIITFEFFIKLCILMYLYEKINDILQFQSPSNHSTITIKTGSNDRPTRVKQGSNKGATAEYNHNTKKEYFENYRLDQFDHVVSK